MVPAEVHSIAGLLDESVVGFGNVTDRIESEIEIVVVVAEELQAVAVVCSVRHCG